MDLEKIFFSNLPLLGSSKARNFNHSTTIEAKSAPEGLASKQRLMRLRKSLVFPTLKT